MKKLAILAFAAFVFCGCEKDNDPPRPNPDPDPDPVEESGINRWVYNVMKENYLWAGNMPSFEDGDANIPTKQYFDEKLRYRDNRSVAYRYDTYGDRFSYIEKTSPGTRAEEVGMVYDAGFIPVTLSSSTTEDILFLQVCYVTPGSPADGKLKRGDAFRSINGTVVTYDNIHRLLSARTMEIEVFDIESTGYRTVTLSCDGYYPQPIVADIIYDDRNTAYLAYTDFVMEGQSGPTGSMSALREAFARYKAAGVRNLILDLRYNGGGVRNVTILLASLIARSSDLGQVFMYSRYNTGEYEQYDLLDPSQVTENADIETLVVLTSNSTASASELIINCLKPYYGNNMSVIGETTVGKNVGSRTYVNERWGWEINPIVGMSYNKDMESGYEEGLDPDVYVNEFIRYADSESPFFDMGTLGDYENEYQLNVAMHSLFPDIPLMSTKTSLTRSVDCNLTTIVMVPERGLSLGRVVVP